MTEAGQHEEVLVDLRGERLGAASERIVAAATKAGYNVVATGPGAFRIARTKRPTWAIVMAILFGIALWGLLFLLVKRTESATIVVFEDRTGAKARVVGVVDPALLDYIANGGAPVGGVVDPPRADERALVPDPVRYTPGAVETIAVASSASTMNVAARPAATPSAMPQAMPTTWAPTPLLAQSFAHQHVDHGDVDIDKTMARPARVAASTPLVSVTLPDGRAIAVSGPFIIGRNPDLTRAAGASALAIVDPSLSKTHALLQPTATGVRITDLHSTNGTVVVAGGATLACVPDVPSDVAIGSQIIVGEVQLKVTDGR